MAYRWHDGDAHVHSYRWDDIAYDIETGTLEHQPGGRYIGDDPTTMSLDLNKNDKRWHPMTAANSLKARIHDNDDR